MTEAWVACSARPDRRQIAFTFDDGPSGSTLPVLDVLEAHGARGTFFAVGEWVIRLPEVVRETAARGHELGNHTWKHFNADVETDVERWRAEIQRTSEAIERETGQAPRLFRPPYGANPCRLARVAAACGLNATILWTVQSTDWQGNDEHERIETDVVEQAHAGAIVLHHDGWAPSDEKNHGSPQNGTLKALPRILERLGNDGYRFVTVSELLAA
ncbi:MAG TPA: polysaccharide deacetylase family protein [Gaiellaceae bacterium]